MQVLVSQAKAAFGAPNVHAASDFWTFPVPMAHPPCSKA